MEDNRNKMLIKITGNDNWVGGPKNRLIWNRSFV